MAVPISNNSFALTTAYIHVRVDAALGAFTVYLPRAADFVGQELTIIKTDSSTSGVTIAVASGSGDALHLPSGANPITAQWQVLRLRSTATAWQLAA